MAKCGGFALGGPPGSGKTNMLCAFTPKGGEGQTSRLIIDMEGRAGNYRAQEYSATEDDPSRLLYAFDLWPSEDIITAEDFIELYEGVKSGKIHPDMIGIDNVVLFQDEMSAWCQDKAIAQRLADVAGIAHRFKLLLQIKWATGDPGWYKLLKSIIKEFLLECRRKNINVVVTTELKNKWQDYGKRGYASDGMPYQRIVGKQAALWEPWLQVMDTVWNLRRSDMANKLLTAPIVELDRFTPKCSIVGLEPQFTFTSWVDIWEKEAARNVPTAEAVAKLAAPRVEFTETEVEPESSVTEESSTAAPKTINWGMVLNDAMLKGKDVWMEAKKWRDGKTMTPEEAKEKIAALGGSR